MRWPAWKCMHPPWRRRRERIGLRSALSPISAAPAMARRCRDLRRLRWYSATVPDRTEAYPMDQPPATTAASLGMTPDSDLCRKRCSIQAATIRPCRETAAVGTALRRAARMALEEMLEPWNYRRAIRARSDFGCFEPGSRSPRTCADTPCFRPRSYSRRARRSRTFRPHRALLAGDVQLGSRG